MIEFHVSAGGWHSILGKPYFESANETTSEEGFLPKSIRITKSTK
jgi:hypothetical protein